MRLILFLNVCAEICDAAGRSRGVALAHKKWSTFQRIFQPSFNSNSYQHPFAILILLQCGRRGCTLVSLRKWAGINQKNCFHSNIQLFGKFNMESQLQNPTAVSTGDFHHWAISLPNVSSQKFLQN